jgi:hypothetical protein
MKKKAPEMRFLIAMAGRRARKADNFTAICEPIVLKTWEPRPLTTQWASTACYRDNFFCYTLMAGRARRVLLVIKCRADISKDWKIVDSNARIRYFEIRWFECYWELKITLLYWEYSININAKKRDPRRPCMRRNWLKFYKPRNETSCITFQSFKILQMNYSYLHQVE